MVSDAVEVYSKTSKEPIVTVYNGIEGIKAIYLDTLALTPDQTIYAFLNPEDIDDELYKWLNDVYIKERVKRGITAHVFVSNKDAPKSKKYLESSEEEKRIVQIVEDFGIPFECEVDIYGNKVALINYNPKGEISGMIIHHPVIANTIKSFYLHFFWKT